MIKKIVRPKQVNNQDKQAPKTIQELMRRYDLENNDICEYLDYLTDYLNQVKNKTYMIVTKNEIPENTNYVIPCSYKVGDNMLDIYYMGEKLINGVHYKEIGTKGTVSNKIQFFDWGQSVPVGRTIEFLVRGVFEVES